MSDLILMVAVYLGIGLVWLPVVVAMSKRQFEHVSPKEAVVHIVAWPWVFFELKLWWLALSAAAIVGAIAIVGVERWDRATPQAATLSGTADAGK